MLELPINAEDTVKLADWLELLALKSGDRNSSVGDLVNALQIAAVGKAKAERLSLEVITEIEERVRATSGAYPFELRHSRVLQARDELKDYTAYIFCLLLSYFGWKQVKGAPINPRLLFESLSCVAAKQYFHGEVCQLGTSRDDGVSAFSDAIDQLCKRLGEGGGIRPKRTLRKKDDHVDLVVWRHFKDRRESKLVIFGQCKTGENWDENLSELQPDPFWGHWMVDSKTSPLGRSFFIPHRISDQDDRENWKYTARYAGILFDRCRVAYWAWIGNDEVLSESRYFEWCESVLEGIEL